MTCLAEEGQEGRTTSLGKPCELMLEDGIRILTEAPGRCKVLGKEQAWVGSAEREEAGEGRLAWAGRVGGRRWT